jgi:DNA-binding NarL/FixJ family response regulator
VEKKKTKNDDEPFDLSPNERIMLQMLSKGIKSDIITKKLEIHKDNFRKRMETLRKRLKMNTNLQMMFEYGKYTWLKENKK